MFRSFQPQRGGIFVRLASDPEQVQEYVAPPGLAAPRLVPTALAGAHAVGGG